MDAFLSRFRVVVASDVIGVSTICRLVGQRDGRYPITSGVVCILFYFFVRLAPVCSKTQIELGRVRSGPGFSLPKPGPDQNRTQTGPDRIGTGPESVIFDPLEMRRSAQNSTDIFHDVVQTLFLSYVMSLKV